MQSKQYQESIKAQDQLYKYKNVGAFSEFWEILERNCFWLIKLF